MSQPPPARHLFRIIWKNFISSLKPRQLTGDLKGTDYFGNRYYEIPADTSRGKTRSSRWFTPPEKENFDQEMPAEWESWLRFRRNQPPSEEEIKRNVAIIEMKRRNAVAVSQKSGKPKPALKGMETFPARPEYEIMPGKSQK